jgi:hypothetical protein
MRWEDVIAVPPPRKLRHFAILWLFFWGALAVWQSAFRGHTFACFSYAGLAAVVGLPGVVFPASIRMIYTTAMILAYPIGWIVSHLVLSAIYFGLFAPLGILFRLIGRDVLNIKFRSLETYWISRLQVIDKRRYFHQY